MPFLKKSYKARIPSTSSKYYSKDYLVILQETKGAWIKEEKKLKSA